MRSRVLIGIMTVLVVSSAASGVLKPPEMFTINVKTSAPWTVAYQKFTGPYSGIPVAMADMMSWVGEHELIHMGPVISEYYNNPMEVDSTELIWSIMIPVLEPLKGFPEVAEGGVRFKRLEQLQVTYTYHQGPYSEVVGTYMRMFEWITQNTYQFAGPMRELYWSDPGRTPQEALISELQIPVMK